MPQRDEVRHGYAAVPFIAQRPIGLSNIGRKVGADIACAKAACLGQPHVATSAVVGDPLELELLPRSMKKLTRTSAAAARTGADQNVRGSRRRVDRRKQGT